MLQLILLILAIMFVAMLIPQFLVRSILGPVFRVFVIPGVIVHELSHALFCLLTGAKIQRIRLFRRDGGDVAHLPSKIPFIGPLLITFAPLVIGLILIILLARLVAPDLSHIPAATSLGEFPQFLWLVVRATDWGQPMTWLWLYFILAIGATAAPSWQDLKNSWWSLLLIAVAVIFVLRSGWWSGSMDQASILLLPAFSIALFILLVIAVLAGVVYLLSSIFGINK